MDFDTNDVAYISNCSFRIDDNSEKSILEVGFVCQQRNKTGAWPDLLKPVYSITIAFIGITNLSLKFSGTGMQQLSGFSINDISENGWEEKNYEVEDYENGVINFYCERYELVNK